MDSINKLIFFFLLFLSTSAYSSAQLSVDFKATSFQQLLKTNTGLLTSTKFTGRNIAGRAVYGLRTVPIGKAIVGNVLKNRAFSPWGVAITAAITAAGYFLNNSTGEIEVSSGSSAPYSSTTGSCIVPQVSTYSNKTLQQCLDLQTKPLTGTINYLPIGTFSILLQSAFKGSWLISSVPSENSDDYLSTPSQNATDEQIYDSVADDFSDQDLSYALTDPQTGHPDKQLTPLVDVATDLTEDYDDANDTDTNTDPDTDNQYDTGDGTITENVDEIPNSNLDSDAIPTAENQDPCELNPDALGCQEFGDELTSVDIPTQELQFSFDPVILTSNASCPAAQTLNLSFGVVTIENQPICDFMTGINPIVLTVCSLLSLYLVVGGVKQNV